MGAQFIVTRDKLLDETPCLVGALKTIVKEMERHHAGLKRKRKMRIIVNTDMESKYTCTCCGAKIRPEEDYCSNCGAGIDWVY